MQLMLVKWAMFEGLDAKQKNIKINGSWHSKGSLRRVDLKLNEVELWSYETKVMCKNEVME